MRALVARDGRVQFVHGEPEPAVAEEVLIRPILGGICNTDLELVRGYYGYQGILGHEFVGEVLTGPAHLMGRRVVGEINVACGRCDLCRAGMPTQCRNRTVLGIADHGGAFADRLSLPAGNLHLVPDTVSNQAAVFTEPLAAALQVLELVHIRPSNRVLVVGAGKLGMLVAQVVRLTGADLAVVVRHDKQAGLLRGWGIPVLYREAVPEGEADVVVDCTGQEQGFADSMAFVRPCGVLVLKSTYHGLPQANLTQVAVREVTVVGSRCGPFAPALRLLAMGLVDVESLIEHEFPFERGVEAFGMASEPGRLKVLLSF